MATTNVESIGVFLIKREHPSCPGVNFESDSVTVFYPLENLEEEIKNDPRERWNFTLGHKGDENHKWELQEIDIYQGDGYYKTVCILYYQPVNIEFMQQYVRNRR